MTGRASVGEGGEGSVGVHHHRSNEPPLVSIQSQGAHLSGQHLRRLAAAHAAPPFNACNNDLPPDSSLIPPAPHAKGPTACARFALASISLYSSHSAMIGSTTSSPTRHRTIS